MVELPRPGPARRGAQRRPAPGPRRATSRSPARTSSSPPGSLAARMRAHERGYAMVTGTTLNGTHTWAGWASYFLDHAALAPGAAVGGARQGSRALLVRREALLEVGGFPEDCGRGRTRSSTGSCGRAGTARFGRPTWSWYIATRAEAAAGGESLRARPGSREDPGLALGDRCDAPQPDGLPEGVSAMAALRDGPAHRRRGSEPARALPARRALVRLGILAACAGAAYESLLRPVQGPHEVKRRNGEGAESVHAVRGMHLCGVRFGRMAVVEVPDVSAESVGLRPFHEFDEANATWPRGDRPAAIREAAAEFRARFATAENRVTRDPHGRHRLGRLSAQVRLRRRRQGAEPLHQHHQPPPGRPVRGLRRAACGRSPTSRPCPRARRRRRTTRSRSSASGEFLSYKVLAKIWNHPDEALAKVGLRARGRRLRQLRPPPRPGPALRPRHDRADRGRGAPAAAAVPEREADRPAQGVGHLRLAAPDAVGLVRRGRDQGPDHRQRRPGRGRRRARQGRGAGLDARATPTATTRSASTPPRASGSPPRTASPPTTGTRTSRRSRACGGRPSSSAAR